MEIKSSDVARRYVHVCLNPSAETERCPVQRIHTVKLLIGIEEWQIGYLYTIAVFIHSLSTMYLF